MNPRDRLIVALDVPEAGAARALVDRLAGRVGLFKIGSQVFTAAGPDLVREIVARGDKVFLDLKFHDIPNTVAGAVASASHLGVSLVDVHGLGGRAMIEAAVGALPAMGTRLLAITILTSHDDETLDEIGVNGSVVESVRRLAQLAKEAGADGVVASPHEVQAIREACGRDFLIVTPGIRPAGAARDDQARLATPAAALAAGADYLVVGRPITEAADPAAAADAIVREMETALGRAAERARFTRASVAAVQGGCDAAPPFSRAPDAEDEHDALPGPTLEPEGHRVPRELHDLPRDDSKALGTEARHAPELEAPRPGGSGLDERPLDPVPPGLQPDGEGAAARAREGRLPVRDDLAGSSRHAQLADDGRARGGCSPGPGPRCRMDVLLTITCILAE